MDKHIISGNAPVVEALDALNRLSGETMTLFVVDSEGMLLGSLTDGDIRRALLSGAALSDEASSICNHHCLRMKKDGDQAAILSEARRKNIVLLPVVEEGRIVSLIDLRLRRGHVPADAVLMAGGAGERLRPLTSVTPKPLLDVGGQPIIAHNIGHLKSFGIERIYVTVNYMKEKITDYLQGVAECVEEPFRMGTIGSLSLIEALRPGTGGNPTVLVMNADLLTDINLEAMYLKHIETEAWLTMAVVPYSVSVPFAIIDHREDKVTGLTEKPTFNYYANAGIYLIRKEAIGLIPSDMPMDATDLIESLLKKDLRVSLFPIEGRWIDIGSPDDYRHAREAASMAE